MTVLRSCKKSKVPTQTESECRGSCPNGPAAEWRKMDIQVLIRKLVSYGVQTGLVPEEDVIYTTNRLLELFELDELEDRDNVTMREDELEEVLKGMLDYAYEKAFSRRTVWYTAICSIRRSWDC